MWPAAERDREGPPRGAVGSDPGSPVPRTIGCPGSTRHVTADGTAWVASRVPGSSRVAQRWPSRRVLHAVALHEAGTLDESIPGAPWPTPVQTGLVRLALSCCHPGGGEVGHRLPTSAVRRWPAPPSPCSARLCQVAGLPRPGRPLLRVSQATECRPSRLQSLRSGSRCPRRLRWSSGTWATTRARARSSSRWSSTQAGRWWP
jgi:hypothetical protein